MSEHDNCIPKACVMVPSTAFPMVNLQLALRAIRRPVWPSDDPDGLWQSASGCMQSMRPGHANSKRTAPEEPGVGAKAGPDGKNVTGELWV